MVTPAAMAGATGPATLAGTMAMSNAEALAGIVAVQMIREGTPVIYGCQSTSADMRTGGYAIGCPEHALCVTYGAALARFYGLPCRGGGSPTDAKRVSVQSGYESMKVMMATCQAKIDLIVHGAGIMDGHAAMSYEQFVIDLEIIGMIRRFMRGIRVDDDSLALDIIKEVGSAGQFLTSPHTFRHCRSELWTPEISLRGAVSGEEADEKIMERIQKKHEKMLAGYQKPQLPADVGSSLHSYLKDTGVDPHLLVS
jgi:trimethylamine--corrinoid protein Co-methyltransferase